MTPTHEKVSCPICGSSEAITFRKSADIVRCGGCDLVYLRTRLTKEAMFQVYQSYACEASHMRLPKTVEELRTTGIRRESFLQNVLFYAQPPGRILDIGCGWAGFLLNARSKGFQVQGVELTGDAVDFSNEILGIHVQQGQLEESDIEPGLKVVTMIHALEHLPYPWLALKRIASLLQDGGWFCGVVPNIDSACSNALGEAWGWLDPSYHYVHYTPKTLESTLEKFGFSMVRMFTTNGDFHRPDAEAGAAAMGLTLAGANSQLKGEEIHFFAKKTGSP